MFFKESCLLSVFSIATILFLPIITLLYYHNRCLSGCLFGSTFAVTKRCLTLKKIKDMDFISMYTIVSIAAMAIVGTMFSVWYARHEHMDVK